MEITFKAIDLFKAFISFVQGKITTKTIKQNAQLAKYSRLGFLIK